jgi:hypothetical protein
MFAHAFRTLHAAMHDSGPVFYPRLRSLKPEACQSLGHEASTLDSEGVVANKEDGTYFCLGEFRVTCVFASPLNSNYSLG